MAMGKRRRDAKQASMWVATHDLPRRAAHPFYKRLNQILDQHDFDGFVEGLCARFYAEDIGRPGLPPGRYFRLLLIGYFEGLDAERGIAWRAAERERFVSDHRAGIDLAFSVEQDTWNGERYLQLAIADFKAPGS